MWGKAAPLLRQLCSLPCTSGALQLVFVTSTGQPRGWHNILGKQYAGPTHMVYYLTHALR